MDEARPLSSPKKQNWGLREKEDSSASPSSHILMESQEQFLGLRALAHTHHTHCICAVTFSLGPWSWHKKSPASCATWQLFLPARQTEFPSLQKSLQFYPPSPRKWSHSPSSPSQTAQLTPHFLREVLPGCSSDLPVYSPYHSMLPTNISLLPTSPRCKQSEGRESKNS